jgi:hypothetical protein
MGPARPHHHRTHPPFSILEVEEVATLQSFITNYRRTYGCKATVATLYGWPQVALNKYFHFDQVLLFYIP